MSRQSKTWADMVKFIQLWLRKEQANPIPDSSMLLAVANMGVDELAAESHGYSTYWDNSQGGDLTISGYSVTLPIDCLLVESVEWDGADNPLERTNTEILDSTEDEQGETGWRLQSGDPTRFAVKGRTLLLNAAPSGTVTGKLVVRGVGTYPHFTENNATNPLDHIVAVEEYAFAYYTLSELPFDPEKPLEVYRASKFAGKWEKAKAAIVAASKGREREPFRF